MKQRIISMLILTALLIALLPQGLLAVSAYSDTEIAYPVEGGNIYFDRDICAITNSDTSVTVADIPSEINGVPVTNIFPTAFYGCISLTSVTIPDSVMSIGERAFYGCSGLTNVSIPDSVTNIEPLAFNGCSSLTIVTIGNGVTSVSNYAFSDCSSLTAIEVSAENPSYCSIDGVLFNKTGTGLICCPGGRTDYVVPDTVAGIGDWAFYGCSGLTSVTIGNGVTSVGEYAFSGCSSLESITIPDSVTGIGPNAFFECNSLKSVTIGKGVTFIGYRTFLYCSSLIAIEVSAENPSFQSIDGVLFKKTNGNKLVCCPGGRTGSYVVPDGVTSIGDYAFYGCSKLTSITIGGGVTSIDSYAFDGCSSLGEIVVSAENPSYCSIDGVLFNKDSSHILVCPEGKKGSCIIPDSVTSIGSYAFVGCSNLTSVIIGNGVTSVSYYAFSDCSSLTAIEVSAENPSYCSIDGVLFNKTGTELLRCPSGRTDSYVIPDGVTSIGKSAFWKCCSLTSITIPNGATSIGEAAFWGCGSLTSITIPDGVTSIANFTFVECRSLTSIMIPDSVTGIGDSAFYGCTSLTNVSIPDSVTSIGVSAFSDCTGLQSVCFMGDAPMLGERAFQMWDEEVQKYVNYINIPRLTIYFIEGKNGWTSPTWEGYPTATWDGVNLPHIHSYQVLVTAPTCTEQGYTTHICTVCGDSYVDTYVDALGHDFGEWTQTKAPTCTEKGSEKRACSRCDTFETREIDALGHKYENGVCVQCGEKDPNEQPTIEFVDVPQKAWFVEAVNYAVQNGLMNGVGNDQFNPEGSMTRAMLVTVLWRYEGEPEAGKNTFSDVPNGQWYTNAVAWAAENGIVGGVGNNRFDPNGEITREQMATILFRYAEKKGIDTSKRGSLNIFSDAKQLSAYAENPVKWAVAEQIINGSDGKLLPQGNATRAQVATILMRFIENNVKKS